MKDIKRFGGLVVVILWCFMIFLQYGCAKTEVTRGTVDDGNRIDEDREIVDLNEGIETTEKETGIYDLEDEILEEDQDIGSSEFEEEIEPLAPDSFSVEDFSLREPEDVGYDLGYRVQIFASSELEKAEEIKNRVVIETGLLAYIEYEGDLYKVRVGNFRGRDEAASARSKLVEFYPDCWIVKTTILK